MTKYLKTIDFFVIGILVIFGVGLIAFGILYDSHLYRFLKENRLAIKLYDKEIIKTINKENPREVFAALMIIQKHNNMILQKKITFHMIFIIGIIMCFFSIFYLLSSLLSSFSEEIDKIHKYHADKEREKKEKERKKSLGF